MARDQCNEEEGPRRAVLSQLHHHFMNSNSVLYSRYSCGNEGVNPLQLSPLYFIHFLPCLADQDMFPEFPDLMLPVSTNDTEYISFLK